MRASWRAVSTPTSIRRPAVRELRTVDAAATLRPPTPTLADGDHCSTAAPTARSPTIRRATPHVRGQRGRHLRLLAADGGASPRARSAAYTDTGASATGSTRCEVRATDGAGTSPRRHTGRRHAFFRRGEDREVDTVAPDTVIIDGPGRARPATPRRSSRSATASRTPRFECRVDGGTGRPVRVAGPVGRARRRRARAATCGRSTRPATSTRPRPRGPSPCERSAPDPAPPTGASGPRATFRRRRQADGDGLADAVRPRRCLAARRLSTPPTRSEADDPNALPAPQLAAELPPARTCC